MSNTALKPGPAEALETETLQEDPQGKPLENAVSDDQLILEPEQETAAAEAETEDSLEDKTRNEDLTVNDEQFELQTEIEVTNADDVPDLEFDLTPPPENLNGLIDPDRPSQSALIHASDLKIARNLRRLEVHRYEIAQALETLKEQEIEGLVDETEEIELAAAEQDYIEHLKRVNNKRKQKSRLDPDQLLDETLKRLKAGLKSRAKKLLGNRDIKDLEFMGHNFCLTWHKKRYDQPVEDRLIHPEISCPRPDLDIRPVLKPEAGVNIDENPEVENHCADDRTSPTQDKELDDTCAEKRISDEPNIEPLSEGDPAKTTDQDDKSDESRQTSQQSNFEEADQPPLCAPVRLVEWSLDQLAVYQDGETFRHFAFLDPKAGHGRSLLVAAGRDFRAIWGFEEHPELAEAARHNIRQYPRSFMTQRTIEVFHDQPNIEQWAEQPLLVHLFQPHSEDWLQSLLDALFTSFSENPRQIYLVTIGNKYASLIENMPFLSEFKPEVSNLEMFSLMSPYNIRFYHSSIPNS